MNRSVLYFRDGEPCESNVSIEDLEAMYKVVMRGAAEVRVRVEYHGHSILFDLQYLDPMRTFGRKEKKNANAP